MKAMIKRKEYKQLDSILWDIHCEEIDEKTAFSLYERRWSYIDQAALRDKERRLIQKLTNGYGGGIFMPLNQ